jgi:hypothetical protein
LTHRWDCSISTFWRVSSIFISLLVASLHRQLNLNG